MRVKSYKTVTSTEYRHFILAGLETTSFTFCASPLSDYSRVYDTVINRKRSEESIGLFMAPDYIQHHPLIPDGAQVLGKFFGQITKNRSNARVVVHKIIAVGDFVFAHVNFLNLFNDDPNDSGIAGVDICQMDANGLAIEHWDTLQLVGSPENSAPWLAPNLPRANQKGMF